MAKHFQLELIVDMNSDGHAEADVTPVDTEVNGGVATAIEQAIALADLADAQPGDGILEAKTTLKIPALKLFGKTFTFNVPITLKIKVVDK